MTIYTVTLNDPAKGDQEIGTLEYGLLGQLTVVTAAPDKDEYLRDLVERMNAKTGLDVEAPPPPDARRFARFSRKVERGDAEFRGALKAFLQTYYGLSLSTTESETEDLQVAGASSPGPVSQAASPTRSGPGSAEPGEDDLQHAGTADAPAPAQDEGASTAFEVDDADQPAEARTPAPKLGQPQVEPRPAGETPPLRRKQ